MVVSGGLVVVVVAATVVVVVSGTVVAGAVVVVTTVVEGADVVVGSDVEVVDVVVVDGVASDSAAAAVNLGSPNASPVAGEAEKDPVVEVAVVRRPWAASSPATRPTAVSAAVSLVVSRVGAGAATRSGPSEVAESARTTAKALPINTSRVSAKAARNRDRLVNRTARQANEPLDPTPTQHAPAIITECSRNLPVHSQQPNTDPAGERASPRRGHLPATGAWRMKRLAMADEEHVDVDGESIRISSPGRVVFPEQGWTKLDVIEHFLAVRDGALRGIAGRPTMLKRYMKGVGEPPVYHKRAAKNTPFDTVRIRFPSQRPGIMNVPRTTADVIRLAQLGCLDFHPWPARAEDIDHPDELRIDLDPTPGFGFEDVRRAAGAAHDLFDEVGLISWPKTTGSRGIHVYVRIEPLWTFNQVRRAVLAFARELERRMPDLVTTKWWKEERSGVFIDFNQMARDKTVSSAYGVRPTGFVSAPFEWSELDEVHIEDFPMIGYADRYRLVGDLTKGIDDTPGRIDTLLEWMMRDEEQGIGDAPWPPHYPKQPGEPPRVQPSRQRRSDDEY